jgi:hypothetical protein
MATTITKILVRDTDKQADTAIEVKSGQTLYLSELPKNWTLDFELSQSAKVIFTVDGKTGTNYQYWSAPYCPIGHNVALNLAAGAHNISVQIIGESTTVFSFSVAQTPAVTPVTPATPTKPVSTSSVPSGVPVHYVDALHGDDKNDGSQAKPFKTARAISKAAVVLAGGQTFNLPASGLNFDNLTNAWVGAADPANPATLSSEYCLNYTAATKGCTLANVILTSPDGKGFGGNHHGTNNSFINVSFGNLSEGIDHIGCTDLTIIGGKQIGKVAGRCHYMIGVANLTWTDSGPFGPASTQSPIRFTPPGVNGGTITRVSATQVGSPFPIACWAIHSATNVTFNNCSADDGEFSFNTAGSADATVDFVKNCIVNDLVVTNSFMSFDKSMASGVTVNRPVISNPGGPCISLICAPNAGNKIIGGKLTSAKHGVMFDNANDTVVSNTTLYAPNATVPILDGNLSKANDGGGNTRVIKV